MGGSSTWVRLIRQQESNDYHSQSLGQSAEQRNATRLP